MTADTPFEEISGSSQDVSPGTEPASVIIVVQRDAFIGPDLRWPLRIAKQRQANITLLTLAPKKLGKGRTPIDLSLSAEQSDYTSAIAQRMRAVLDAHLGAEHWTPMRAHSREETDSPDPARVVELRVLAPELVVEDIKRMTRHGQPDLVLFVGGGDPTDAEEWTTLIRDAVRSTACPVAEIVPGPQREEGRLLVAAGTGPHARAAIELASRLAADTGGGLTALFVEPDIGPDAVGVGHRILDRRLKSARQDVMPGRFERRVAIHEDPAKGIVQTSREESFDLIVLGADRPEALGDVDPNSVPNRVLRAKPNTTLMAVRAAIPLASQAKRWFVSRIRERVPQLTREGRIGLIERVESNSRWSFDFMLLIGLSTSIATLGLLDNSPAVVIGAMLVAPLMTPLLGLGLAITQGNALLARWALKAAFLGFVMAFGIAYVIGLIYGADFDITSAMRTRDWPQMRDLIIALLSGIAAAYASGRPGLLAALPGVAIAASLVPPLGVAGLAMSIGRYHLALGAVLLFLVNAVAIITATALTVWAVGIRDIGKSKRPVRLLRNIATVVMVGTAVLLTYSPPLLQPPAALVDQIETVLADDYRLRGTRLRRKAGAMHAQVDVGGAELPGPALTKRLADVVHEHLGKEFGVRLTFRYEVRVD